MRRMKALTVLVLLVGVLGLSGCASISSAYKSVTTSVSDFFKSDSKDKKYATKPYQPMLSRHGGVLKGFEAHIRNQRASSR